MGMFDTFYDEKTIVECPHCKESTNFPNGIQSKKFESILVDYYVGDVIPGNLTDCIEDYDWCPKCKNQIPVWFGIKHGIFTGIYKSRNIALKGNELFDFFEYYKKQYDTKVKIDNDLRLIRNRLETVIKTHGSKPVKSNFSFLFTIHNGFLDYDIIQTLKNILKKD